MLYCPILSALVYVCQDGLSSHRVKRREEVLNEKTVILGISSTKQNKTKRKEKTRQEDKVTSTKTRGKETTSKHPSS